jgi:hypothetical protein
MASIDPSVLREFQQQQYVQPQPPPEPVLKPRRLPKPKVYEPIATIEQLQKIASVKAKKADRQAYRRQIEGKYVFPGNPLVFKRELCSNGELGPHLGLSCAFRIVRALQYDKLDKWKVK